MGKTKTTEQNAAETRALDKIDRAQIPSHVAIIMDGNGRWAKSKGFTERIKGHEAAGDAVRAAVRGCGELGVKALTLYAFSTENWNRPAHEVMALMRMLERFLKKETPELEDNNVRLVTSGDISRLPDYARRALDESMNRLSDRTGLVLNLALNYGGRQEIQRAMREIARQVKEGRLNPDQIEIEHIAQNMYHPELGDPDLLIRTSGELRVSNFMLWGIAYSEIVILDIFWPDFRKQHLYEAIARFQGRDRRFGGV